MPSPLSRWRRRQQVVAVALGGLDGVNDAQQHCRSNINYLVAAEEAVVGARPGLGPASAASPPPICIHCGWRKTQQVLF